MLLFVKHVTTCRYRGNRILTFPFRLKPYVMAICHLINFHLSDAATTWQLISFLLFDAALRQIRVNNRISLSLIDPSSVLCAFKNSLSLLGSRKAVLRSIRRRLWLLFSSGTAAAQGDLATQVGHINSSCVEVRQRLRKECLRKVVSSRREFTAEVGAVE